uniref:Tensin-1 n=1 Tax=Culex pipiens TaxID=7175 RepID=A0A8D8AMD5_CULPI
MDVPPKSRYTDTSYLIFQQLKEGGLQCAFPAIWDLLHPGASGKVTLPDELPAGVEPLAEAPSKNGKKVAGQYKAKDSRKSAASGIPRKQSKIAEKRKNRRSLELKAVEEAPREEEEDVVSVRGEEVGGAPVVPVDEKKLQICDMSGVAGRGDPRHVSVISSGDDEVQKDIQVAVDFHHRPNSEVEPVNRRSTTETNNNDVRCKSHNDPAPTLPGDSDVESVRTVTPGPVPPREVDRGKAPGVQIRRKQYDLYELPYLTGSEYSESDFTDTASSVGGELELDAMSAASSMTVEYATVEVRQKNHEDEQQQVINKYNSLPLHALQNQQQQHQYQSPHLQQSRPASSLSHVNNNNGNHYHNYSSAHQHHHNNNNGLHQSPSWSNGNGNATGPDGPLRLSYVTERILASILPARRHRYRNGSTTPQPTTTPGGSPGFVDEHERELIEMLEQKHERNYRIFDLESCIASISLEKLCELCKHIDSWLGSGKEKIVVLQDRSDKQRLGAAIAAYLEYQKICGSNFPQSNRTKALPSPGGGPDGRRTPTWLDLDLYSTQRFLESVTGPLRVPSHKRYIRYFSGLLAGTIKMNASSVFLRAIIVESPPCLHYRAVTVNSEWRSFIKVYEGVRCLFTSDIYVIPITTRQFIYEIKHPLRLRGDVLVRCYQIIPNNNKLHDEKELVSAVQFHTCAITEKEVQFAKLELDLACDDERFPADHKLTLCIDTVPNEKSAILVFQNPLVRIEPIIENGDHLETINGGDESNHTQGPLDGSLYATILKSPKSPTATGSQQTLISPPAEFSNGKPLNGSGSGGPPPVTPPPRSSTPGAYLYESAKRYHQSANGGTASTATLQRGNAASSHSNNDSNNNNNVSGNYRDVIENGSASASGYDQNQNPLSGGSGVGVRDSGRGSAGVHHHSSTTTTQIRSQADGRESSVRSPLTLSMDSGISSSGAVNRRLQGSSVSPSSFPSQASPQDDRHRELDDLLSDMLMTVQGIPDAVNRNNSKNHQSQQSAQHHQADHFVNTSTDTIKRSHSAQLPALREEPLAKERELLLYETSSTTTTLTPPPSESGRDTPLLSSTSNYSTIRDKRELTGVGAPLTPTERELIMNLQQQQQLNHQSFGYPRQARSTTGASERFTSDDDDDTFARPYHAREDSRPFTYGSIPTTGTPQNPPASTMIKMQSGLSSPSMVRKALGTPNSTRKSATSAGVTFGNGIGGGGRNSDFEEMLRERRDKVLSEKYTIGDQQSSPGGGLNGTDTVDNAGTRYYQKTVKTVTTEHGTANGYPHEPLKRSNTMDGSFGRQFSNDGISGQTWLQLQQQKLRARKEQQKREHSNSFSYSYGSPAFPTGETPLYHSGTTQHRRSQTLSPVRNSNNERNYHTLTTTTRTHSTERPFVAVKRAHENAKMQTIGSAPLSVLNASPHGHVAQALQHHPTPSSAPSPSPSVASTTVVDQNSHHHQQIQQQQHVQYTVNSSSSNGHHQQQSQQQQQIQNGSFNGTQVQNGLLSLADQDHSTPKHGHVRLAREESFSSYRSETEPDNSPTGGSPRPETPAFPVTPRTPYGLSNGTSSPALPPKSPTSQRKYNSTWSLRSQKSTVSTYDLSKDLFTGQRSQEQLIQNQNETMSCYTSRRNSTTSNANSEPQEVAPQFVKFARDSSKYWYKPAISREEAIGLLRNAAPGTFVVRDSTTFANAYGLVVKVAHPPPGVQPKAGGSNGDELVRHFLVEPTIRGVRLKGCSNEPVFTSLSALVYQHSITPLALPCRLIIPDMDLQQTDFQSPAQQQLLTQGAACNVLYLFTCDTESLTGPQAIRKAVGLLLSLRPLPKPTQVHYKVSIQGITLTDNTRQLFFRRHYPSNNVSFCGLDPDEHRWSIPSTTGDIPASKRIFAFVAKRSPTSADNQCHVFCELEATQPATAIVSFANKVVLGGSSASSQPQQPVARAI